MLLRIHITTLFAFMIIWLKERFMSLEIFRYYGYQQIDCCVVAIRIKNLYTHWPNGWCLRSANMW